MCMFETQPYIDILSAYVYVLIYALPYPRHISFLRTHTISIALEMRTTTYSSFFFTRSKRCICCHYQDAPFHLNGALGVMYRSPMSAYILLLRHDLPLRVENGYWVPGREKAALSLRANVHILVPMHPLFFSDTSMACASMYVFNAHCPADATCPCDERISLRREGRTPLMGQSATTFARS